MFINRSSKEINLRVVFFGPVGAGKGESLRSLWARMPPDSRGKLITATSDAARTLFFDFLPEGLDEIRGFRVRLHLYALTGEVRAEAAHGQILRGADGVVFVADSRLERFEDNAASRALLDRLLTEQGRDPAQVPQVYQLNQRDRPTAAMPEDVLARLASGAAQWTTTEAHRAEGLFPVLKAITRELLLAMRDHRLIDFVPTADEQRAALDAMARSRLVGHLAEYFGEPSAEIRAPRPLPDREIIVVEHPPTPARPFWSFATAGLSLRPQASGGREPLLELIAYAPVYERGVPDVLHALARGIAKAGPDEAPYKTHDTVDLTGIGLIHSTFVLALPPEPDRFLDFPDPDRREADRRFVAAVGAEKVHFVQIVPVTAAEIMKANADGTPALLRSFFAEGRSRTDGWPLSKNREGY